MPLRDGEDEFGVGELSLEDELLLLPPPPSSGEFGAGGGSAATVGADDESSIQMLWRCSESNVGQEGACER